VTEFSWNEHSLPNADRQGERGMRSGKSQSALPRVLQFRQPGMQTRESQRQRAGVVFAPLILLAALLAGNAWSGDSTGMLQVQDLRREAAVARAGRLVLVLEFASDSCAYCRKLESLFLLPMQRNAAYDDKILLRSISLSDFETLIDFDGQRLTTNQLAARYGVSVTPTLLFLNAEGTEMSDRLVGIWSEDFYGAFIDNRIDEASSRL
jgi:thioredoxin-related protein